MNRWKIILIAAVIAIVVALGIYLFKTKRSAETVYRPLLAAGIPPIAEVVQTIAGSDFQIVTLLPPGKSPHDYNPETRNIRDLSRAEIFFHCALPVEEKATKLINAYADCFVAKNIQFIDSVDEHDSGDDDHHEHSDSHDPHIWLNIDNLIIIGNNIRETLVARYPFMQDVFNANFAEFEKNMLAAKAQMLATTSPFAGKKLFVYHPAFGYFAKMVNMQQCAVELEGREPSPRQLAQVIKTMKSENARLFFAQTGFSPLAAQAISRQTGAKVVEVDVLSRDIVTTMLNICKAIKDYE